MICQTIENILEDIESLSNEELIALCEEIVESDSSVNRINIFFDHLNDPYYLDTDPIDWFD